MDVPASIWKLIGPNGINPWAVCTFDTGSCGHMDVDDDNKDFNEGQGQHTNHNNDHDV
jgi:hypothetical protein